MGRSADYTRQKCAIAATLDIVGEPWTLLIVRDALGGITRFEQWQDSLGLARNVLAARLKHLVAHGVMEPQLYCARPKRYEYVLTQKGLDLRPLVVHLMDWGTRHVYAEATPIVTLIHTTCDHALVPQIHCSHCAAPIARDTIYRRKNEGAVTLRELYGRSDSALDDLEV